MNVTFELNDAEFTAEQRRLPPKAQALARKALRARCHNFLFTAQAPVVGSLSLLFYLCLPTAFTIVKTSSFRLWDFDLARTLFVFLQVGIVGCLGFSIYLSVRVLVRAWKLRPF